MVALRELQSAVRSALLGGDPAAACRLVQSDGIDPAARLAIYRHHVTATLTRVPAGTFPVVCRLVDPRFFAYAADRYLREHPPASPCLFEYGVSFPAFLAAFPPCRAFAWLPDLARLEWAINVAFHAEDARPLEPAALAAVAADRVAHARFHLDPSLTFLQSQWPVDEIWTSHRHDEEPAAVQLAAGDVALEVRRAGDDVLFQRLLPAEFDFRRALAAGSSLGAAAEAAFRNDGNFDLAAALAALFRDTVVVGFGIQRGEGGSP